MTGQRQAPRPERVTTILSDEDRNGHVETDPPRPPPLRAMRLSVDESVERLEDQGDQILGDLRDARIWQEKIDRRLDNQDKDLRELKSSVADTRAVVDNINDHILEFIARVEDTKVVAKKADDKAERAQREAKAAREVGERSSSTNEVATSYLSRKLEQDLEAGKDLLKSRRAQRKLTLKYVGAFVTALIGATISAVFAFKGCH